MSEEKVLIIPARRGSKRIKNKNFIKIGNNKLIDQVVINALKSDIFSKIIISTDNKSYIDKSLFRNNKKILFNYRNSKLSNDESTIIDVVRYIINFYKLKNQIIFCTFPTSIFVNSNLYKRAINKYKNNKSSMLVTIKEYEHPIDRAIILNKNKRAKLLINRNSKKRTQDLRKYYHDAGQFYLANSKVWLKEKRILNDNFCPILLEKIESTFLIDIDEPEDLKKLKLLYNIKNEL